MPDITNSIAHRIVSVAQYPSLMTLQHVTRVSFKNVNTSYTLERGFVEVYCCAVEQNCNKQTDADNKVGEGNSTSAEPEPQQT